MDLDLALATVLDRPGGDRALRCLALMHAATCTGRLDALEALHRLAPSRGVDTRRTEEMALQVVAYAGYPRAIEGLELLCRARAGPAQARADDPDGTPGEGRTAFEQVYGPHADAVLARLNALVPRFADWILRDAYGRILSRDGLTLRERELLAVAALALMALPGPLESHMFGALRNGSTIGDVEDILRTAAVLAEGPERRVLDQALARLPRMDPSR